jgi:transcription antitermination factor NusG
MSEHDEGSEAASDLHPGEFVQITAGKYKGFQATVDAVDPASGKATVMLNLFGGRPLVLELSVLSRLR